MFGIASEAQQRDGSLVYPPPESSLPSFTAPYYSSSYDKEATPTSSFSRISPVLLLLIVILAIIFFIYGLLHLLVRFCMKRPSSSAIYQSNRYPETSGSIAFQRQLQQLFRLHDSGLDQSFIDALPLFYYKDIMGLKEPFDCAVCLCEFSDEDKLRLLPTCGHAFHIDCIDTWLLSNSTCPLCRRTLMGPGNHIEIPVFNFNISREQSNRLPSDGENGISDSNKPIIIEEAVGEKRVFSVRLGKFRSLNDGLGSREGGESSSRNLDARRCYSMGAFQYVVGESNLQVALSDSGHDGGGGGDGSSNVKIDGDVGRKKISGCARRDSFSVSKIWLWSKNSRFPSSSNNRMDLPPSFNVSVSIDNET